MGNSTEKVILAGGCFWGMQDLFRRFPGVISTRVGYTGGEVANATYRNHEGHAEAIEIIFGPTTPDSQGNDYGSSYRSAIFYTSEAQKQIADKTIADIDASRIWPGKVVTEVSPAATFWQAEPDTRTISNVIQTDTHVTFSVRNGSSTLFARQDYVEEAWRIVDRALTEFTPVFAYEPNTWEPKEVQHTVTPPGGWDELAEEGEEGLRIVKPSRASALASQLIEV